MLDTSIKVVTEHFDGPLSLLLHLIEREEMDIRELDLTKITDQYLTYLSQMQDLNFDLAGDYLYLAATLLLLKSKSCVTEEESAKLRDGLEGSAELEITSKSELVRRLEELQHFQRLGQKLWALPRRDHDIFVKPKVDRKAIVNSILTPLELETLTTVMVDLLFREKRKYTVVKRDRLSIKEKLIFLKTALAQGEQTELTKLIEGHGGETRDNVVITFISLLELARLKRISIFQNEDRGAVYVDVVGSLEDFDVETANGFEPEGQEASTELPINPEEITTDASSAPVFH
jgi:segregation and condensation protein A